MAVAAACAAMTGCASIVGGHIQSLSVRAVGPSGHVDGAICDLSNDKGTWYLTTPGSAAVQRSYQDLLVKCRKDTYAPGELSVRSTTKALAAGNLLFGGLIGIGVDAATGAAYDYPGEIDVTLAPLDPSLAPRLAPAAALPAVTPPVQVGFAEYRVVERMTNTSRTIRLDAAVAGYPGTGDLEAFAPPQGWVPVDLTPGGRQRLTYVARDGSMPSRVAIEGRVEPPATIALPVGQRQAVSIHYSGWLDRFAGPFAVTARGEFTVWVDPTSRRVLKFESKVQRASAGPNQAPGSFETTELVGLDTGAAR